MDAAQVAHVRRFNRTVTRRVGALDDRFLALDRPLGEARVLWEVGEQGCDVRALRTRLGLDSGYLSRLLRSLEADGLVEVGAGTADRRVRTVRLTERGIAERTVLDRRSDDWARSLLDSLADDEREQLVAAMRDVDRLLTVSQVQFAVTDPGEAEAQRCLAQYYDEVDRRFDHGYDPSLGLYDLDDMRPPAGTFVVARLDGQAVGCGGLTLHPTGAAEVKRLWVAPTVRGLSIGRRLLATLESRAAADGCTVVQLSTNRVLTEAIALYRSVGYREVEAFDGEPYANLWFDKALPAEAPTSSTS